MIVINLKSIKIINLMGKQSCPHLKLIRFIRRIYKITPIKLNSQNRSRNKVKLSWKDSQAQIIGV